MVYDGNLVHLVISGFVKDLLRVWYSSCCRKTISYTKSKLDFQWDVTVYACWYTGSYQ